MPISNVIQLTTLEQLRARTDALNDIADRVGAAPATGQGGESPPHCPGSPSPSGPEPAEAVAAILQPFGVFASRFMRLIGKLAVTK